MKNSILKTTLVSFAILAASSPYALAGKYAGNTSQSNATDTTVEMASVTSLTSFEVASLKFMREEEKLARDVYLSLYNVWGIPIFLNIANSEQTHTSVLKNLIEKYQVDDPVRTEELGVFTDPLFTQLYHDLVELGSKDYESALMVGAEIEELDINDINEQLLFINKRDITNSYNNLLKDSRNHIRSFYRLITDSGFEYIPTHISQQEFDDIVNSDAEIGNANISTTTQKGRRR